VEGSCIHGKNNLQVLIKGRHFLNYQLVLWLAMAWTIRIQGFNSWQGLGMFLFSTASKPDLGPSQLLYNGYWELLPHRVKQPWCKADHSPPIHS
jgi:hypothetical protein